MVTVRYLFLETEERRKGKRSYYTVNSHQLSFSRCKGSLFRSVDDLLSQDLRASGASPDRDWRRRRQWLPERDPFAEAGRVLSDHPTSGSHTRHRQRHSDTVRVTAIVRTPGSPGSGGTSPPTDVLSGSGSLWEQRIGAPEVLLGT